MSLAADTFAELLSWAEIQGIEVMMVQSTRWTLEEPWTSRGFHVVPSPELQKAGGGLLTIVKATLCPMECLSYQDVIPGRLLHVRCHLPKTSIDLLNITETTLTEKTEARAGWGIKRYLRPTVKPDSHVGLPGSASREAIQDTFILFLQPGQSSILPLIHQATQQWKQEVEQKQAMMSLRLKLITTISQTLLDRMLKVAQAQPTMEIWQEALKHQLITESGGWNYLTWSQKDRQLQVMKKPAISMTSMQSLLEELVELTRKPTAVVRFKSLKATPNSLDASDQPSTSKAIRSTGDAVDVRGLEPSSWKAPASHCEGEPPSSQFGEGILWPIEKETIMGWLMAVRLSNTGNDCYQNSALLAMFWALLQLRCPTWNDLGAGAERFAELFNSESMWVSLKDLPMLGGFLRSWGSEQHDLHEFLSKFLQWIQPRCVNSSWRRIVQEMGSISLKDQGAIQSAHTQCTS